MPGSIQLHAWEFDTHNADKMSAVLSAQGAFPYEMTQLQYLQLQIQLQARHIREAIGAQRVDGVLPVFLAPEFFFTSRENRPYDYGTFYNALPYFEQISRAYPHVLWCPGTVWWQERVLDQRSIQYRIHNTTLVYQGGRLLRSFQKSLLSGIDPLDTASPVQWDRDDPDYARIAESSQDPFFEARMPGTQEVVTVGVEVCLNHIASWNGSTGRVSPYGDLRTRYMTGQRRTAADPGVDVHLLTAAGMSIHDEDVAARDGGVVLRVDGGQGAYPRSQAGSVTRAGADRAAALRQWAPQIAYAPAVYRGADLADRVAVFPALPLR